MHENLVCVYCGNGNASSIGFRHHEQCMRSSRERKKSTRKKLSIRKIVERFSFTQQTKSILFLLYANRMVSLSPSLSFSDICIPYGRALPVHMVKMMLLFARLCVHLTTHVRRIELSFSAHQRTIYWWILCFSLFGSHKMARWKTSEKKKLEKK